VSASVPILTYHSLDESGSVISTAPDVFRFQILWLREHGWQGISLGELLDSWDARRPAAPHPVVLTFDDAFRNMLEVAAPVLREVGFRATVFAVASYCGRRNDWPTQGKGVPILPLLSMEELRELAAGGLEIGSHSLTHEPLDRVAAGDAEREIAQSRRVLEDGLRRSVSLFAYPYGAADAHARRLVQAHYRGACSVEMGEARPAGDRHWLRRIDAHYLRDPRVFRAFGSPLGHTYLGLRALGRRVKRRLA